MPIKVLHTNDICLDCKTTFKQFVQLLKKLNLTMLKVDNLNHNFTPDKTKPISIMQLRALAPYATHIYTNALNFRSFGKYLRVLIDSGCVHTHFPKLRYVSLCNYRAGDILESDIEMLAYLPVKQVNLSALADLPDYLIPMLFDFEHLKRVVLDVALNADQINSMLGLPVKEVYLHYVLVRRFGSKTSKRDYYNCVITALRQLNTIEETYLVDIYHYIHQFGVEKMNRVSLYGLSQVAIRLPRLEIDTDYLTNKNKPIVRKMLAMLAQKSNIECLHVNMNKVTGAVLETIKKLFPPHKIEYRELPDSFFKKNSLEF